MTARNRWKPLQAAAAVAFAITVGVTVLSHRVEAQAPALEVSFEQQVKPFLTQHCAACHNADTMTAGVRVDHLNGALEDPTVRVWEGIRRRVAKGTMPPEGLPQPDEAERQRIVEWADRALEIARSRPSPRNGIVRRLTVAQYKNTLRELLHLEDDVAETLPPDAVSKDGFVNNAATLELSPLLMEAYFEIAEEALQRSIVDPDERPSIQKFRMDLGESVNPEPLPGELILGANSQLLPNKDYRVTQLTANKSFPFEPFVMRTKYRFIEGYEGNGTVRGWRDFDSIYHAVFAGMRGSKGYPKGEPYSAVPEALLLRPSIPTDELFGGDGTYGPKANFKISLRELPDHGRFRVTVTAAKYNDGLLLDPGAAARDAGASGVVAGGPLQSAKTVTVKKAGVYQVDLHEAEQRAALEPDSSRLAEGLSGPWGFDNGAYVELQHDATLVESPFGQAVSLDGDADAVVIPRDDAMNVGEGDFTVAAWIHPKQLRKAGIVALGGYSWTHGWYLEMPDNTGALRLDTAGPDKESNGAVQSPPGVLREDAWQHVAAVVRRGKGQTQLFVNGYPVAKGDIGPANLDNPNLVLHVGRIPEANQFRGDLDEVRIYSRALGDAEIEALVEPGRRFALPPPEKPPTVTLNLGDRRFAGELTQPAFLAVRLEAGPLAVRAESTGFRDIERVVLTPLASDEQLAQDFRAFEQRAPRLGVHLGLRRDCGSTFAPVGPPQAVDSEKMRQFVFEGAIANFHSPEVEKDNVNYLAGIREIAVRSEYTDGRDMPQLALHSVEFEGPFYDTWPPPSHQSIFIASKNRADGPAYAREILNNFAARAYRRPATDTEVSALMEVFEGSFDAGRGFRESVQDALQVALTSPQFLFLVETSATPGPEPIDDYELASKLSYFLWNGPPDERTLELAGDGSLRAKLDAEVERLIADDRFSRFVNEFTSQWLSLEKFDVLEPDRERFPALTRDARVELRREPIEFLRYLIHKNLPVRNLVQSDTVVANEVVASYYNLGGKTESGFDFVPIVHGRPELGGVLTQAAIMAGLSDGRESNPVKRGAWLARKIVAEPPADPPPNVPALSEEAEGLTLRQRLEQHRNQPGCRQCHTTIDPWGVALEEFNADGRIKSEAVDASSTLPDGSEVAGANDLKQYLGEERIDQVAYSFLLHLATYANGRSLTFYERNALKEDAKSLRAGGYRVRDMIKYTVRSKLFLEK